MKKITSDNFYIQNDYIDDVLNNLDNYDFYHLMFISEFTPFYNKIYDYILLNYGFIEDSEYLKNYLLSFGKYEEYFNRIINCDDKLLKANLVLYLENPLLLNEYGSISNYIDSVCSDEKYDFDYKVCNLVVLSNFDCSNEDINKIKKSVKELIENSEKLKKEYTKEEIEKIVNDYYNQIDGYHKEYIKVYANNY